MWRKIPLLMVLVSFVALAAADTSLPIRVVNPKALPGWTIPAERITWDFEFDQIVIEGKTPWGASQGGGFGNTVQLSDGMLVSCYSYRGTDNGTHIEVVRWRLPAARAKE